MRKTNLGKQRWSLLGGAGALDSGDIAIVSPGWLHLKGTKKKRVVTSQVLSNDFDDTCKLTPQLGET